MQTLAAVDPRALALGSLGLWTVLVFSLAHRAGERLAGYHLAEDHLAGDHLAEDHLAARRFRMPVGAFAAAAVLAGYVALSRPLPVLVPAAVCIGLLAAGVVDARTGFLVDAVTLPTAAVAAAGAWVVGDTRDAALGVAATAGIFGALYLGSRGRALGLGDVKAMYALGAAFGPLHATFAIAAASISGLCAALARGRFVRGSTIRFGPHLAAGAALALLTMRG